MTISYNWLKNYINCDMSAEEISKVLTDIGLEVEGLEKIESIKGGLEGVKIGEVLTCEKHPDADKLSITTVDYGDGPVQIVCGAPNVRAGLKVVVATNGAVLYPSNDAEGFKIKKSKIRGVESNGMLCAEDEIGLGGSHAGIMELGVDAKVGMDAKEYFGISDDYVLEIGLTPNRIDAASHIGVARDVVAYLNSQGVNTSINLPSVEAFTKDIDGRSILVEVENRDAAPRYMGVTVSNLKIAPSPEWLQNYLRAIGINPKNNVVDITNFVLHETGHPIHAFDADKIVGDKVVVKNCAEGTIFKTLDDVERKLSADDLMICNESNPMCIAGVFGGVESGVTDSTKSVFIESAYFNPVSVRKTAKRHALSTDASFRYERGCDPQMTPYALKRAALLMKELAGGVISSDVTDILSCELKPYEVELSISKVNSLIGKEIGEDKIKLILKGLEINVVKEENGVLSLEVPMYRVDVRRDVDVIEDILRIYGYNNIEIPQIVHSTLSYAPKPDVEKIVERISETLSSGGFTEIMSNSLTKASYYENSESFPLSKCVKIVNPLSNDLNVMRQTLLFNAMEALQLNTNRRNGSVKMYEIGNCYFYNENRKEEGGLAPYRETHTMSMLVSGFSVNGSWNEKQKMSDFYTLKRAIDNLLRRFGVNPAESRMATIENEIYREGVEVTLKGQKLFNMGVVSKSVRTMFDIKNEVYFLELNLDTFVSVVKHYSLTVKELSRFPEVKRDLALLVNKSVTFTQLRDIAVKTEKKLLKNVTLFDVYEGDKLPDGKKSYALGFTLEDTTQTMNDVMIDKCMNNFISQFEKQLKAEIRK